MLRILFMLKEINARLPIEANSLISTREPYSSKISSVRNPNELPMGSSIGLFRF